MKELQNKAENSKTLDQHYRSKLRHTIHTIKIKSNFLRAIQDSIDSLTNGEEHKKIREINKQSATSILDSKTELLVAAVVTVSIVLRNDPNKSSLIADSKYSDSDEFQFNGINNPMDSINDPYYRNYIDIYHKQIIQTATLLYDRILRIVSGSKPQAPRLLESR